MRQALFGLVSICGDRVDRESAFRSADDSSQDLRSTRMQMPARVSRRYQYVRRTSENLGQPRVKAGDDVLYPILQIGLILACDSDDARLLRNLKRRVCSADSVRMSLTRVSTAQHNLRNSLGDIKSNVQRVSADPMMDPRAIFSR